MPDWYTAHAETIHMMQRVAAFEHAAWLMRSLAANDAAMAPKYNIIRRILDDESHKASKKLLELLTAFHTMEIPKTQFDIRQ